MSCHHQTKVKREPESLSLSLETLKLCMRKFYIKLKRCDDPRNQNDHKNKEIKQELQAELDLQKEEKACFNVEMVAAEDPGTPQLADLKSSKTCRNISRHNQKSKMTRGEVTPMRITRSKYKLEQISLMHPMRITRSKSKEPSLITPMKITRSTKIKSEEDSLMKPRSQRKRRQLVARCKASNKQQPVPVKFETPVPTVTPIKLEIPDCAKSVVSLQLWGTRNKLVKNSKEIRKPVPCDLCRKYFKDKSSMLIHLNRHTGEKPWKCPVCFKDFKVEAEVTVHLRKHTGDRPYICNSCGKRFIQKSHLVHHERIHTGVKPYKCSECGRRFTQQGILDNHMRQHSGDLPYRCQYCNKGFAYECYLRTHMPVHTDARLFICTVCDVPYKYQKSLQNHVKISGHTQTKSMKIETHASK